MKPRVLLLALLSGCAPTGTAPAPLPGPVTTDRVGSLLGALAADSMEGRLVASRGSERAARLIAAEMANAGLIPAGEDGYFQQLPLATDTLGRVVLAADWAARDTFPAPRHRSGANVLGILPGAGAPDEVVLLSAHYDHVGIGRPVDGDSIYNGADDDASGVVAILEVARQIALGTRPARTIVVLAITGEERGGLGSRWYAEHPVRPPLDNTVANLNVEMIARPDSLAGGSGKAWLTGYERSSMGDGLRDAGIPIVPDPRPSQNFFRRSDNYRFALRGIPAHTLSTFNLHRDYHRPSDEADKADLEHMRQVIEATVEAVLLLADGPRPSWKPGGRPQPDA